jgi:hypothetical protein
LSSRLCTTYRQLAIGAAKGIDGVATWLTRDGRRRFDPEWLKTVDPELYEAYTSYVPKFESARFKADDPEKYAAHQAVNRVRSFHLMVDLE